MLPKVRILSRRQNVCQDYSSLRKVYLGHAAIITSCREEASKWDGKLVLPHRQ